jgi:hypothetical protein
MTKSNARSAPRAARSPGGGSMRFSVARLSGSTSFRRDSGSRRTCRPDAPDDDLLTSGFSSTHGCVARANGDQLLVGKTKRGCGSGLQKGVGNACWGPEWWPSEPPGCKQETGFSGGGHPPSKRDEMGQKYNQRNGENGGDVSV